MELLYDTDMLTILKISVQAVYNHKILQDCSELMNR